MQFFFIEIGAICCSISNAWYFCSEMKYACDPNGRVFRNFFWISPIVENTTMRVHTAWIITFVVTIVSLALVNGVMADNGCRTCGPNSMQGPLKYLIPQGASGADFRLACTAHDDCYAFGWARRSECDQEFLNSMLCQCQNSRNPRRCSRVAKIMYRSVRRFGGKPYEAARHKAASF